jgi:predicted nicotinamide N-methyase
VIELGAGTALPGMVAAAVGAATVTLSDHAQFDTVLTRCRDACAANGLERVCDVIGLSWGTFPPELLASQRQYDWVLGADVLYDPVSFEDLLVTVVFLLEKSSAGAMFVTAYQGRSADRSLDYLLAKWGRCTHLNHRRLYTPSM